MLGALFIQNGIGVVDVDQDAATPRIAWELLQEAARSRKRQMTHFVRRFVDATCGPELVVAPEGAIDEDDVASGGMFGPFWITPRQGRSNEQTLAALLEDQSQRRFVFCQSAKQVIANEVRIRATKRNRSTDEGRCLARSLR